MLAFLYEVGKSRCLSLCSFLSGFSRSPALLLSSSDQSGTVRHLITVLRMVCKWKLKNCSFLEFFPINICGSGLTSSNWNCGNPGYKMLYYTEARSF